MAVGESFRSLAFQYRVHHSWISIFVREVLESIKTNMREAYMPQLFVEQMKANAKDFFDLWNYPNCCGALDGKHIRIRCPNNGGSLFFNYKQFHSVVLLAIVDARYRFVAVDIGSYGREGDSGMFNKSLMGQKICSGNFNIPTPDLLPGTDILQPFVILGDAAFSLTAAIMKPYSQKESVNDHLKAVYNYRHSRARRTSENAFGLMSQYFRVFYSPIAIAPDIVDSLIMSACILHNMLRNSVTGHKNVQDNNETTFQIPRDNLISLAPTFARRSTFEAISVRNTFKEYFGRQGSLPWQNRLVQRTD